LVLGFIVVDFSVFNLVVLVLVLMYKMHESNLMNNETFHERQTEVQVCMCVLI
jgi:multisubunit Na+/H+ antiporter MnhC subunit